MDEQSRRKFLQQFAVLSAGIYAGIFNGCKPDYGPVVMPAYGVQPIDTDPPDVSGNLFIRNAFGIEIVLYDRYNRLKLIGSRSDLFRVHVPREVQEEIELEIFQYMDIFGNLDSPSPSKVVKKLNVNLPVETSENPSYIWIIDMFPIKDCGEMKFSYNQDSEYNVDVNLIISERIRFEELVLGNILRLGLTYGEYLIEYVYWRGNSPKAGEKAELGRISTENINGEEVPIRVTLDAENKIIERIIPNWEG